MDSDAAIALSLTLTSGAVLGAIVGSWAVKSEQSFWQRYARVAAVGVGVIIVLLTWRVSHAPGAWWKESATIALIAAIVGAVAPLTSFVSTWANIQREESKQEHEIVSSYLKTALDVGASIHVRQQLLRFLSIDNADGKQLQKWASAELKRLEPITQNLTKGVDRAFEDLEKAKTPEEYARARALVLQAQLRLRSATELPVVPKVSPASLRASMHSYEELGPLAFSDTDLSEACFQGCKIRGSVFERSNLSECSFVETDARGSNFDEADLTGSRFPDADLRAATFKGAKLINVVLEKARLEGADLAGAEIAPRQTMSGKLRLGAIYDQHTTWPAGFDADAAGCIRVETTDAGPTTSTAALEEP